MTRALLVLSGVSFAGAIFARTTDPLVPQIAADFAVDPNRVTLLATAFALPWALMQPILGPLGDLLGKARVLTFCLVILALSAVIGAFATSFPLLVISRVVAGMAAGGVNPVSMALVSDLVPVEQRQIAMGRVLTFNITGILLGGAVSGVLADFMGWRSIFFVIASVALLAAVGAGIMLRGVEGARAQGFRVATVLENYRLVLGNPRTKVCYSAVFLEGVAVFGIFPFIALLLAASGEARASIAGLVISAFAVGGIVYAASVRQLVARFTREKLMLGGGVFAAIGLIMEAAVPPWPVQVVALAVMGFGFYMLHACIMVEMSELAPDARGTAVAGHAFFYFIGQALGPAIYGFGFMSAGAAATLAAAAVVMTLVGIFTGRLLRAIAQAHDPRG
ncbi:MAG TPA: MFS transporter [Xanthobacteraceae bacterium]